MVVRQNNELGVKVQHIPGGCTGLFQPVDVGVSKPLKDKLRDLWESWMIEEEEVNNKLTTDQPRRDHIDSRTTAAPK